MRKIMLAATAIAGFSALAATAQAAEPNLTTDSFASGLATGAALAPGTISVHLKASLTTDLGYGTDNFSRASNGKNSGILLGSYMRLYPRFDAVAANGLEYGATMEFRTNLDNGTNSNSNFNSRNNTVFTRRYNGYIGTPSTGRFFFGAENGALARFTAGTTMEDFDSTGGFFGDSPNVGNNATQLNYITLRQGTFYTANKLVYISPAFAGFSVGTSWEPSQNAGNAQANNTATALVTPQTSSFAGPQNLRRNTLDIAAQYKNSFGPVAITSFVGYLQSGHVIDNTAVASTRQYKDLKVIAAGARVTYGPFAIGGAFNTGDINANGAGTLIRQGNKKAFDVITGAQYIIGPVIMGVQYINNNSAGNNSQITTNTAANNQFIRSNLHETGVIVGGAYDWAPGATLFTAFLYGQRHQGGWNFGTGAPSTSNVGGNLKVGNSTQVRAIQIGNTFKW